jgi:flagellar biosynthesis/type III secretory pathway chaperone
MNRDTMVEQLLGILGRETELYQALSAVMKKEKNAAIQSDLKFLNEAETEKENILVGLGRLEEQRQDLVAGLADSLGHPPQDMNLTMISQWVGEPFAGRLKQAGSDLSALSESLQIANQRNKQLFEHSRELLTGSLSLLSELKAPHSIYYRTGNIQSNPASGKCVCDEI